MSAYECTEDDLNRIAQTLSVIALTLADFRRRLETLERPTRWARFTAWCRTNIYDGRPT